MKWARKILFKAFEYGKENDHNFAETKRSETEKYLRKLSSCLSMESGTEGHYLFYDYILR
jgi:hypothetical protein